MKLFLVHYWGPDEPIASHQPFRDIVEGMFDAQVEENNSRTTEDLLGSILGGLYAVRAANPEDCAHFLLRTKVRPTPGQDTTGVMERIRENIKRGSHVDLSGTFKHEKLVDCFENHENDFI
jgi:hypothetical protein